MELLYAKTTAVLRRPAGWRIPEQLVTRGPSFEARRASEE